MVKRAGAEMAEGTSCGRCHLTIARFAPQVVEEASLYHRECYEAWFFSRHGRRPALVAAPDGRRQRYRARDRAA